MKLNFLALLSVVLVASTLRAHALDCTKASTPIEKQICSTPKLKKADDEMSAAYFKRLKEITDPDFREALIRSQRRWLEVRSTGPDRFGLAESDTTDDREVLLKMTSERLSFLRTADPIRTLELQRRMASEDGSGTFAGYRSYCILQPPPYGNWNYECWGEALRQHKDRICSSVKEWSSGGMTEHRAVGTLKNGAPKVLATCSTGFDAMNERCPEPDADVWAKLDARWNTSPDSSASLTTSPIADFWKFDPDIDPTEIDRAWMHDCLFSAVYPPPAPSRPSSKEK